MQSTHLAGPKTGLRFHVGVCVCAYVLPQISRALSYIISEIMQFVYSTDISTYAEATQTLTLEL